MKIDSLKELQKVILLCRKLGVYDIKIDGVELRITEQVKQPKSPKYVPDTSLLDPGPITSRLPYTVSSDEEPSNFGDLSEEDRMFYSVSEQQ